MSPQVSWLFFKARAKSPYLSHTGRASNAEKQPTGRGPEGCVENGPAAATTSALYARRYIRDRQRLDRYHAAEIPVFRVEDAALIR